MQTPFSVVAVSFDYTSPRKCQLPFYRISFSARVVTAHAHIRGQREMRCVGENNEQDLATEAAGILP